jgi:hypothetical protein
LAASLDQPLLFSLGELGGIKPEADILADRHMRIDGVVLEHHGDIALLGFALVHHLVGNQQIAARNVFEPGDHAQSGGFAAARRADKDDEFAVFNSEVDAMDGPRPAIFLDQSLKFDLGHQAVPFNASKRCLS